MNPAPRVLSPQSLDPENERRLRMLFARAVRRVGELKTDGGEIIVRIRLERGGRVSRDSRITVDEFPLTAGGKPTHTAGQT